MEVKPTRDGSSHSWRNRNINTRKCLKATSVNDHTSIVNEDIDIKELIVHIYWTTLKKNP